MSSNCSLVTGPGMSSSSICAESCGRAALPLAAAVLRLRGMKTPLVECYASHTKFLTGSHLVPPLHQWTARRLDPPVERVLLQHHVDVKPQHLAHRPWK